jgi:hypothetical protein
LLELEEPINLGTEEKPYIIEPKKPIIVGAKENTYIMEIDWEYPLQFVIEDRLGVIEYENTKIFPNANGPDRIVDYYSIPRSIIIKCTSKTNITLVNGRLVQRSLFTTIPFSDIDPNKPVD